jgi:hypothetical protein
MFTIWGAGASCAEAGTAMSAVAQSNAATVIFMVVVSLLVPLRGR